MNEYFISKKNQKNKDYIYRFNDEIICNDAQSMLIYEWTPYSSLSPFRISDGKRYLYK